MVWSEEEDLREVENEYKSIFTDAIKSVRYFWGFSVGASIAWLGVCIWFVISYLTDPCPDSWTSLWSIIVSGAISVFFALSLNMVSKVLMALLVYCDAHKPDDNYELDIEEDLF